MKFKIVKIRKGNPIVIKEALAKNLYTSFPDENGKRHMISDVNTQIWSEVIHDGNIKHVSEIIENDVDTFHFGFMRDYNGPVSTIKTKNIIFRDANYVMTILKAKEGRITYNGRGGGYYDIGKELVIYLNSIRSLPKALKALVSDDKEVLKYDDIKEPVHKK